MYNFSSNTMMNLYKELKRVPSINKKEEQALFNLVGQGSGSAREKIVAGNIRFVIKVALQYKASPIPLPDMISEGILGLDRAVGEFDCSRGLRFISYAIWWIRAYIIKSIYERGYIIRLSGSRFSKVIKGYKTDPDKKHVPGEMRRLAQLYREDSIFKQRDQQLDKRVKESHLAEALLKKLPPGQASILRSLYGLDGMDYLTITEIAELRGVCTETIRRERDRGLNKLWQILKGSK